MTLITASILKKGSTKPGMNGTKLTDSFGFLRVIATFATSFK
jgi:hypothetical protein